MSSGGGGGLGCTGAMGAVLVVAMVATLAGELAGPGAARGGVSDPGEGGRRLAFRLLEELDHEPRAWTGDPLDLAAAPIELLWLPDLPMGFHDQPDYIEEADPLGLVPDEEPIDHRALRGLVDYVARGGDLVLPLGGERTLDLAERLLGLEADLLADVFEVRDGFMEGELDSGLFRDGDAGDELEVEAEWEFGLWEEPGDTRRLWIHDAPFADLSLETLPALGPDELEDLSRPRSDPEPLFAAILQADAGRVVLVSEHDFWTNTSLPEADNALALVRLVERLDRPLWFDETVLRGHAGSWLGYLLRPPLWPLTAAFLVLAALAAWRSVPRRGFTLEERLEDRPAPLERARGRAGLLLRADRPRLLAADLVAGVRARLGDDDENIERRLRAAAPTDLESRDRWLRRALDSLSPDGPAAGITTTAELLELGATLAEIETRIQES